MKPLAVPPGGYIRFTVILSEQRPKSLLIGCCRFYAPRFGGVCSDPSWQPLSTNTKRMRTAFDSQIFQGTMVDGWEILHHHGVSTLEIIGFTSVFNWFLGFRWPIHSIIIWVGHITIATKSPYDPQDPQTLVITNHHIFQGNYETSPQPMGHLGPIWAIWDATGGVLRRRGWCYWSGGGEWGLRRQLFGGEIIPVSEYPVKLHLMGTPDGMITNNRLYH